MERRSLRVGLWAAMPEPLVLEAAAAARPDWVGLDLQHGAWDLGSAFRGIQLLDALGVPVLVRVSEQDLALIPRVLDHGASGVVIAMVSSVDLVRAALSLARYQPEGVRSYGGQRYGLRAEPPDVATVRPAVYPMVEDRRGLEDVVAIASVDGIAGIHVGPVDLGLGLGLGLDRDAAAVQDAIRAIATAGRASGISLAMHAVRPDQGARWLDLGFDQLVLTADIELLRSAFETGVRTLRGQGPAPTLAPYGRRVAEGDASVSPTETPSEGR
jgi:4-hydroxy-2-oxoheptanedioate aldolase